VFLFSVFKQDSNTNEENHIESYPKGAVVSCCVITIDIILSRISCVYLPTIPKPAVKTRFKVELEKFENAPTHPGIPAAMRGDMHVLSWTKDGEVLLR
jgi:hypothetical protein